MFSLIFTMQWLCFTNTKITARGRGICPEAPHRLGKKIGGQKKPNQEYGRTGFGPHPTPRPLHPTGPWAPLTGRRKGRPGEAAAPNGLLGASLPGGGRRVASVGPAGGGGAAKEALAAGSDPRGAAARLACNAPTGSAARCPLTSGGE